MVYHKHGDAVGYILSSIHVSSPVIIDSCPSPHLKVPKIFFSYRVGFFFSFCHLIIFLQTNENLKCYFCKTLFLLQPSFK